MDRHISAVKSRIIRSKERLTIFGLGWTERDMPLSLTAATARFLGKHQNERLTLMSANRQNNQLVSQPASRETTHPCGRS